MRLSTDAASSSWTVPVPVRRSRFAAMDPAHDVYNVETDLAAIGAFSLDPERASPDLLYADLQTLPQWNGWRRLGSGRAGILGGAYLKGIGRTSLAANWADSEDRYHNSGHMLPSAAVREYLSSRAIEELGLGATICPCTGLLAAPLDRPADRFLDAMMPESAGRFAPIDRHLQAITVKPADFARLSNFTWGLDHLGMPSDLANLLFRMHAFLSPPDRRPRPSASSPDALAAALAAAVERGIANFGHYMRAGVFWGSLSNNVTADGRFLDLEVPMVLLRPFFGIFADGPQPGFGLNWIGLEVYLYVLELRGLCALLRERFAFLARHIVTRGVFHDFVDELVSALDQHLPPEHILWSGPRLVDAATSAVAGALGLDRARTARVRTIAERQYQAVFEGADPDWSDLDMRRLELDVAPPEPGLRRWCAFPHFLDGVCTDQLEAGALFNDRLRWIEVSRSTDELFERVQTTTCELRDALAAPRVGAGGQS
jgi:hypothetical protein